MKLCSRPAAPYGLAILAFLCNCATAVERRYYIAAVNINWDYTSAGQQRYEKDHYLLEYKLIQSDCLPFAWLLGPTLRGQEGDTIIVTFKNMADNPCSIHPHGIAYGKQSEGSLYFDNTSLYEKEDDVILPGQEHTYHWEVTSEVTPMAADPPCITYTYLSHFDIVKDYNTGLIGTMLICKKGTLDGSGNQINFHQEAVLLFGVFDENKSWYSTGGPEQAHNVKYTINGYTNGSVPDLDICVHSKVSWHLLGMSSEPELFSVHFNGQVLLHDGHKTSSVGIISGTATSASMNGIHPGRWLISSHISRHLEAGLHGYLNIKTCDEYTEPKRRLTIQQKQESQEWTYYIAAEEMIWDYAPNMDFRSKYLKQGPQRIGKKYKKAVFTQYKDGAFKERAEDNSNNYYFIYSFGLRTKRFFYGITHGIQPGEIYTYTWSVSEEDTPTDSDPRCLTRMYHSAVDTPRDIASGLVGPLLICKSQSLNKKNVQLKADKEQHAMFTVFDENKSWYHDENINTYCSDPKRVKRDDPEFYKSNVMHTINGYVYESGQELGFCNGEIVTWHVSNVGEQDYIQTATFYGHTFELKNREQDLLSLFPMTGETITMNMLNIGIWLLASLNSHDSTKGMRVKFKDLECFRDYVMEYDYEPEKFTVWKPVSISDIKKEEPKQINPIMVDEDTEIYAEEFGLRTFKNFKDDVELIDFSILDIDDGLLPTIETKSPASSDELDKSHNTTFGSFNQIHGLSADEAGLDKRQSSNKVLNESTEEALLGMASIFDSKPEVMSNNDTDSIISHFPVVERKVRNVPTKPVNEMESVSTNVTLDIEINTNIVENVSSSLEADSVSVNTTHSPIIETNITHTMNEIQIFPTNTSITSSDAPVGDRNITMEGDSPSLNSSESNLLLSNQTLENKTVIQEEANTKNNTDLDGDRDSSGHFFIYHVPSPDSLSNSSETQTEEDFVLLDGGHPSEVSTDYKTLVEYNVSPTDTPEEIGELTENTTKIQELNSTKVNYTGEMFSQVNSETESIFNLGLSSPLRNSTLQSNESESSNATLSDFSLDLESEITENRTSPTNVTMKSHSEILRNASELFSSDSTKNVSFSLGSFNVSSTKNGSESESEEEVVIYLKNNHSEAILTSHLDPKEEHWGYEGNHELVHMEIPDHMNKYISDKSAANSNKPKTEKKKKVVHQRVKPRKGYGMKTKKRKEYRPQPRSDVSPKGFSPRGFGPSWLTPRGSRPISSEDDLMGKSIVIGVPRRDFNDYELYVPKNEQSEDFDGIYNPFAKSLLCLQRRLDKSSQNERPTSFKKAVFRKYLDSTFSIRDIRGEMDEHLGILGPVIKAEVDQTVMVFFRNLASRKYSLHANGVKYLKQMEGLSYDDQSPYWYKQDDAVQLNSTFIYMWTINSKSGPQNNESDCRTWTYYSAVNPERDINSGLIGPLLVCRKGTLDKKPLDRREFVLLFMTFDENKSWYYEENRERIERKNKRAVMDPNFKNYLKFDAINGIIYSLKGLRMYTNQLAKWHLINMGSPKDLHSVHFHGQTFINKELKDHRQGVYPLLPGGFATLEMLPSKPGLWQLESEVGLSQQRGMQTLFLVLDNVCDHPLGLISGTVKDEHISASDSRGQWYPHLARLHNTGKYNAWSTTKTGQHIQVDFQRPVVISKVATQGAKQLLKHNFVLNYTISYSTDKKKWTFYKGDSDTTFEGNSEAYDTKENIFFPPLIGRYVRLYPLHFYSYPTVRLEYYGCELDGCSVPLGIESGLIKDAQITASSVASSWYSGQWHPWYARLNKYGTTNAWQNNDMQPWIQVELKDIKKITGIITQGAKSLGNEMFVTAYSLEYSEDGKRWTKKKCFLLFSQTFQGNTDNNGQVKNYIYPPIFSKFIRIIPKQWQKSITMRIELLGCDFE
uniref:Venom prothrombin activator omicarin-C non-catalytic subunit-like n=1 Tax=Sinocyclocheilus grahami TaxID=75366 RepID=A0A672TAW7_SINGR